MNKPIIFISHISEEKEIALALKSLIGSSFLGMIDIFVSSDYASVSLGRKWLDDITASLKNCDVEIIICSPLSVERQWINFEAGAGWIRDIPVIPLCHSGMEPSDLPIPLKLLQAGKATEESALKEIFSVLAKVIGSKTPETDFSVFINKVRSFELTYLDSGNLFTRLIGKKPPEPSLPELSDEAKQLLIEISQDRKGSLLIEENSSSGDLIIQTHGKSLCNSNDPRSRAAWKDAVMQLNNYHPELLKRETNSKYSITTRGYQVADELKVLALNSAASSGSPLTGAEDIKSED